MVERTDKGVFPAPAGMNRGQGGHGGIQVSVPRACGDEPYLGGAVKVGLAVFPAPAGMNRGGMGSCGGLLGVPRACGDEPISSAVISDTAACSPRLRG